MINIHGSYEQRKKKQTKEIGREEEKDRQSEKRDIYQNFKRSAALILSYGNLT